MATKQRHYSNLGVFDATIVLVILVGAAVKEHILFATVPVHVTIQSHFALPGHVLDQLLGVEDRRVQKAIRLRPFTVEITPEQRASIIAVNYTIRVQHWHYFEYKMFA